MIAEQAAAPDRLPAHAELQRAGAERAARPGDERAQSRRGYAEHRQASARVARRHRRRPPDDKPRSMSPTDERERELRGALASGRPRHRRRVHRPADRPGGQRAPPPSSCARKIRETVAGPGGRRGALPARLPDRHQAPLRRHRLLRDVQPRRTSRSSTSARDPIEAITPRGRAHDATRTYELDALVFATGFDAMTGALLDDRYPRPRRPRAARQVGGRARAPTSARVAGFPNLFTITGPGSPSVLSNMVVSIEQHVDWIADCIAHLRERGLATHRGRRRRPRTPGSTTSTRSATRRSFRGPTPGTWAPTSRASRACSCPTSAASGTYRTSCDEVAANGYEGFSIT